MPLKLVATPIGNAKDITLRALEAIEKSEFLICEEFKPARAFLKSIGLPPQKEMLQLNEHSKADDIQELVQVCEKHEVALITDCGTPGFCDPGAHLVKACRQKAVPIEVLPGASSLMAALSYSGERIDQFLFAGFLPANKEERQKALGLLKKETRPLVILDTPYRLKRLIEDVQVLGPKRKALLTTNLTSQNEQVIEGPLSSLSKQIKEDKAEFVLIVYP